MAEETQTTADPAIDMAEWNIEGLSTDGTQGNLVDQKEKTPQTPSTSATEPPKPETPEPKVKFTEPAKAEGEGGDTPPVEGAPAHLKGEQLENWKELRTTRDEAVARATEFEQANLAATAELTSLKSAFETYKTENSAEVLQDLKSKLEDYQNQIRRLNVDEAPEVKAARDQASIVRDSLVTKLKAALPDQAANVEALLALPTAIRDAQINEALSKGEANIATLTQINVGLNELDKAGVGIDAAKEAAAQAGEAYQARKDQAAAEAAQQRTAEQNSVLGEVLQAAAHPESGLAEFRMIEGNDAHNAQVKERMASVRNTLLGDISFQDAATEAVFAQVGREAVRKEPAYQQTIAQLTATVEAYKAKVGELTIAEPGSSGTANAGAGKGEELDFVKAVTSDMMEGPR